MATTTPGKDTIYIDIDDEITTVIEKVRASNEKIVALVLPKRASVLQSIVNMKLLKRTADKAKKHVVLITSEAGLLPLAGAVGFFVAKNLQTKPEVPAVLGTTDDEVIDDEPMDGPDEEPEVSAKTAGDRPIGELAVAAATADEPIETLSMDDSAADSDATPATDDAKTDKSKAPKKNRKLAVPSFDKFRLRLLLAGVLLIILIVGIYLANVVLPKGTITITTDTSDVNSSLNLTFDTQVKALDATKLILPATVQTTQKSGSQQVATTGKQNNGTTATGQVTLSLPDCSVSPVTVPAGTGVTSNGLTFITQTDATMSVVLHNGCQNSSYPAFSTATVDVVAQQAGTNYNIPPSSFKVAGYSYVAANSKAAMTGGTDNIIQIVAQADIDSATQKIAAQNTATIKSQLQTELKQAALDPIVSTFATGTPTTTVSSKVGDQASTVTVTQATPYTMFGVKVSDLKTVVDNDVKKHIDPAKQSILTEGLDSATFHVNGSTATTAQVALATTATAGPDLNADTIKTQVSGKKSGDIKSLLKQDPGVTQVDVHFSPFWVNKAPKASKLTVIFQKASS